VTVLEVIQKSAEFLARRGVESARLNAELLVGHVLATPRLQLYLNFERPLQEAQVNALRELVKRRGDREPLQHLTGSTSFCGLEIKVGPSVLIPRPETETLAELGWKHLSAAAASTPSPVALDYGTGSGCLAIALATQSPQAIVHALDCSPAALAVARANAARHHVEGRIQFHEGSGLSSLPDALCGTLELLVSNPPYIPTSEIATLAPEVRDHDPRLALDGGVDGLDHYRHFAEHGARFLKPGGVLLLEFGDGQADAVRGLFQRPGWGDGSVVADLSGTPRIFVAQASPP
jgi:release factor glutamine methyltransferase